MSSARAAKSVAPKFPITVSHPEKIYWPDEGYTKLDLVQFYANIFPRLSPYVKDRILTLERCPGGMSGQCFYQKEKPDSMPPGTPTKRIQNSGGKRASTNYVVGGSLATQLALANLGCIALHVMGSRAADPRKPDWLCLDLDPQSGEFSDAVRAAVYVKEALDALKLVSFPKTSGSRGMHVFVPLRVGPDADNVLAFAEQFAGRVAAAHAKELTVEHSIAARGNRVYLDPFRNGFAQTVVAPYSVRRREKAPVSMPLSWSDVESANGGKRKGSAKPPLAPADFNIGNFADWAKRADPWADFFTSRQSLTAATKLLKNL